MADLGLDELIKQDRENNKINRNNKVPPLSPRNFHPRSSTTTIAIRAAKTITPISDSRKTIDPSRKSSSKKSAKKETSPARAASKKLKNPTGPNSTRTTMTTGRSKFALLKCSD